MSDTTKSVDDELLAQIDMEFARFNMLGNVQLIENITQLFAKQLQEAEIRAYQSVMAVAETEEGRRHAYDFCAMKLAALTQDTKGGTDDTPRVR